MTAANPGAVARSRPELVELLRSDIEAAGKITFARFMEQALTHPQYGYYTAGDAEPGFEGDFLTAPETHPVFGAVLARQLAECWERLDRPTPFVVREHGAGSGSLALTILAGLREERPDVLAAIRYELGDVNDRRVAAGLSRATEAGFGDHVAAAGHDPIIGVILANELLDALPVHRLVVGNQEIREAFVCWRDGWFAEESGPVSDVRLMDPLIDLPLMAGQRLEVSPAASAWTTRVCAEITRGYAILIDYGYEAVELYDPLVRPDGLLRTYWQHIAGDDPFDRVGRQDITAHVDFTAVSRAATDAGCDILGLTTQAALVAGLGVDDLLLRLQEAGDAVEYVRARETVMHLLDPRGLGRFRVLVLGRGVEREPTLRGLSFRWP